MKIAANIIKKYRRNTSGNFGLWTALMSFPVLISASMAVDYGTKQKESQRIKGSLDMAVLAAASNNKITDAEKAEFARNTFMENYTGNTDIALDVIVDESRVEMTASAEVNRIFSNPISGRTMNIDSNSKAVMDRKHTICVLALAENGEKRVSFVEGTEFNSPTCVVQSNSSHPNSIVAESTSVPIAKAFCSAGGAQGKFEPHVRGECRVVEDPYTDRKIPKPGMCMPDSLYAKPKTGSNMRVMNSETRLMNMLNRQTLTRLDRKFRPELLDTPISANRVNPNQVLYPGTYCGGLTLDAKNVTLMPGTYIMKDGALTIKNGADVFADRVSIVMTGKDAIVTIETGAKFYLKAPKMGPLAGLAIVEDTSPNSNKPLSLPSGVNIIASGGELDVIGALYFPTQALDMSGTAQIGARAPATSFIAYDVTFAGTTKANVKIDHVAAGIPPMLPLADDAARLVQ